MEIRLLRPDELAWANDRYRAIDFKESSLQDLVAVAEIDNRKVGLGRIVPVGSGIGELGGMHVLPDYQGKSIAAHIVSFLSGLKDFSSLYCIPFAHLAHFYRRHGFVEIACSGDVPRLVADKFQWCGQHYPEPVVLMHRAGAQPNLA
jgi:N-acetylglutamate synthase-like GNAT family acetyltransferase